MRRVRRGSLQLREHHRQLVGRMLGVEEQPVEAGSGDHLHRKVTGQAAPQADLRFAGLEGAFEIIGGNVHDVSDGLSLNVCECSRRSVRPCRDT